VSAAEATSETQSQPGASSVSYEGATKRYGGSGVAAVDHLTLEVPAGEICVLVGPSGCGKTTAMRMVNRTVEMSEGDILVGGESVRDRDAARLRREIGYVIQQIGLFPHLTVGENIATVPRLLGWSRDRTRARVHELLELIDLDPAEMESRYPAQLSGGQRQRVGVARALAADPPLMLMDEPFGAIDPINRLRLQDEFLRLQDRVKKTVVFVTHDIDEAIKMGDRIAILRDGGLLAQYDTPREILTHPADDFVAQFVGGDRGLKRLSLTTLAELELIEPGGPAGEEAPNGALSLPRDASVRDAVSLMLTANGEPIGVLDAEGRVEGLVTLAAVERLLSKEAAESPAPAREESSAEPSRQGAR
jgi:osmoprotectant transport system ATP-binding protein